LRVSSRTDNVVPLLLNACCTQQKDIGHSTFEKEIWKWGV
jgi:hypothetical protein